MSRTLTPEDRAYLAAEVVAALYDPRVQRALHLALRDEAMRARFAAWRPEVARGSLLVADVLDQLRGPYVMPGKGVYYLSAERVRTIVYNTEKSHAETEEDA